MASEEQPFIASKKEEEHKQKKQAYSCAALSLVLAGIVLIFCAVLGAGVVIGWRVVAGSNSAQQDDWGGMVRDGNRNVPVRDWMNDFMSASDIKENLKILSNRPHIAGSEQNKELAEALDGLWRASMFDKVELVNYSVLLTYPNPSAPNVLELMDADGNVVYTANTTMEPPLTPGEDDPTVAPPFNAYSGLGNATGKIVYVNYGQIEDFLYVCDNASIDLNGAICMARYGAIYRGDKVHQAQSFGCAGMIIYSDPADYAPRDGPPVYPDGPSLPPGGVQRGSLAHRTGDPLSPGLPSLEGIARRTYQEAVSSRDLPGIPVQPISYGDAVHFMKAMTTGDVPAAWQGQMNVTYHISSTEMSAHIAINNEMKEKDIYNVIGTIYGSVEPDKLVVMGNHRDAWVFGSVDPSSGTAVMLEIAEGLKRMRELGWRPGRSIMLCSWDAEEYGLVGSTEWVEDHAKMLTDNAVAYLNVDSAVAGWTQFYASASPLLYQLLYNATRAAKSPLDGFDTVYDQWKSLSPNPEPPISNVGSGSDFERFYQALGVPSSDMGFQNNSDQSYAVYHSVHDNLFWMTQFGDPQFTAHQALGRVWSHMVLTLAITPLLPYHPTDYATRLNETYDKLINDHGKTLEDNDVSTDLLSASIEEFSTAANALESLLTYYQQTTSESVLRILNNKLTSLDRAFIRAEGLPNRPYMKHVLFAPSSVNSYAGASFPGVEDTIFNATTPEDWAQVRQQIGIVAVHVRYATQIMKQHSGLNPPDTTMT